MLCVLLPSRRAARMEFDAGLMTMMLKVELKEVETRTRGRPTKAAGTAWNG